MLGFFNKYKSSFLDIKIKKLLLNRRQDRKRAVDMPSRCLWRYFPFFPNLSMVLLILTSLAAHSEQPGAIALLQRASVYFRSQDIALF